MGEQFLIAFDSFSSYYQLTPTFDSQKACTETYSITLFINSLPICEYSSFWVIYMTSAYDLYMCFLCNLAEFAELSWLSTFL